MHERGGGKGCTSNVRLAKITNGPGGGVQLDRQYLFRAIIAAGRKGVMTEEFGKSLFERNWKGKKLRSCTVSPGPLFQSRATESWEFFFFFLPTAEGGGGAG